MRRYLVAATVIVLLVATLATGAASRSPGAGTPGTPGTPRATATCHWSLPRCGALVPTLQGRVNTVVTPWVGRTNALTPTPIAPIDALREHWTATAQAAGGRP
jgi:hypothetical protein